MQSLPETVSAYRKTPEFSAETTPKALLNAHKTKAGSWALIRVIEGEVEYYIVEPDDEFLVLNPDQNGVIEPEVLHRVRPRPGARFFVEFYR